eukprot:Gb_12110 [translate_table: standard]
MPFQSFDLCKWLDNTEQGTSLNESGLDKNGQKVISILLAGSKPNLRVVVGHHHPSLAGATLGLFGGRGTLKPLRKDLSPERFVKVVDKEMIAYFSRQFLSFIVRGRIQHSASGD